MATRHSQDASHGKVWTIAEAKAKLSEVLRLSESEGPQRIGARKGYVVVPEDVWLNQEEPSREEEQMPMGQWLLERMPRDMYSDEPYERGSERPIPFADWTDEDWAEIDASDPASEPDRR